MTNSTVDGGAGGTQGGILHLHDVQQFAQLHGLKGLTRVAARRSRWIIASIVLCTLSAIIVTLFTRPVYESTATIELNKSSGATSIGISDVLSQQLESDVDSLLVDQQTETAILTSDSLALEVIERLGLASQPPFQTKDGISARDDSPAGRTHLLVIFRAGLKVSPVRGTRLIRVSFDSHDPLQAARIANAIIESYKSQYLQSHYAATSEASRWLTNQLAELKSNVEDSEKKLTDFEKETGIISLNVAPTGSGNDAGSGGGQIHSVVIEKLDALNSELTAAEANRIEKEAIYRLVQGGNGEVIVGLQNDPLAVQSKSMVLTEGGGVNNLQQLEQQQNVLNVNIAQASKTFGPNNRHLNDLQIESRALDGQIRQEVDRIIQRANADFQLAKNTENELRGRFNSQQEAANKLNQKTVQFAVLSQEAYSRKKLYEDLFTKLQEANVSAGLKATNISVVDPARSQSVPIRPRRLINVMFGLVFGVFVGISVAFLVESLDRTVSDPLEVEEITGKPVIGVIPSFDERSLSYGATAANRIGQIRSSVESPAGKQLELRPVWMLEHPSSIAAEAYRVLRTSILLSRPGGGPRVILVTSCIPGEGKTTVTSNLAVAFAQHKRKVIIVEADMRRPKLKQKMDFPGEIGLSSVLAGSDTADRAILRGLYVASLDVLPAGPRPPMPAEILGSKAFDDLLEQLRQQYDVIIIDTPPALLVTDAVSISPKVDAAIWVSQAGVVTRPFLNRAAQLVERSGIPLIGFVVNRLTKGLAGYGYEYVAYDAYEEEGSGNG